MAASVSQRPPCAAATAALIGPASGLTSAPATRTVGVASTPSAAARAVTYVGQSRYGASATHMVNAASFSPTARPRPASSASVSPGPPSGGWLMNSACAYSANRPRSAAQPGGRGRARGVARRRRLIQEIHRMVDQADLPAGHQAGKRRPCPQLKPPGERAQEVDKSIDADRAGARPLSRRLPPSRRREGGPGRSDQSWITPIATRQARIVRQGVPPAAATWPLSPTVVGGGRTAPATVTRSCGSCAGLKWAGGQERHRSRAVTSSNGRASSGTGSPKTAGAAAGQK